MKKTNRIVLAGLVCVLALSLVACASSESKEGNDSDGGDSTTLSDTGNATALSVAGYHDALNVDVDLSQGISWASCGLASPCHEGYDQVVEKTEGMWEGIGQIGSANPHASHASNAFDCTDCHSETEDPVNQCNACHDFESPEGWQNPDPGTTLNGVAESEGKY